MQALGVSSTCSLVAPVMYHLQVILCEGPMEIRYKSQEYDLVLKQLEAAKAVIAEAPILEKLAKRKDALWAELEALTKGALHSRYTLA